MPQSIVNALRRELEAASRDLDAWMQHPARDPEEDHMEGVAVIDAYHKARKEWRDYARAHPRPHTYSGGNLVQQRTEPRDTGCIDTVPAPEGRPENHVVYAGWFAAGGAQDGAEVGPRLAQGQDPHAMDGPYPRTPRDPRGPGGGTAA